MKGWDGCPNPRRLPSSFCTFVRVSKYFNNLRNKKVLITAGPTREYWDPVRFLTNASSGAMGIALAHAARKRGARVTLVLGPVPPCSMPPGVRVLPVVSGWEMYEAVKNNLKRTNVFIGAAAVVDYR